MKYFTSPLLEIPEYKEILSNIKKYSVPINITGPSDSQKAHISYSICEHLNCKGIFIAFNEMQARKMFEDFSLFFGDEVLFFPSKEIMLHDVEAKSNESIYRRLKEADRLIEGNYRFVVTSAEALAQKLISKDLFSGSIIKLSISGEIDLADLSKRLMLIGYERVGVVEGRGQFSVRGGIVDVFPINSENAARIELFDDEIDSIRRFDVLTQRSIDKVDSIKIIPAREVIYPENELEKIIKTIEKDLEKYIKKISHNDNIENVDYIRSRILGDIQKLRSNHYFPGIDRYIPYIITNPVDLTDYSGDSIIFIDEPGRFQQRIENILLEHYESCKGLIEKGQILPTSFEVFFQYRELEGALNRKKQIFLNTFFTENVKLITSGSYNISSKSMSSYQGNFNDWR